MHKCDFFILKGIVAVLSHLARAAITKTLLRQEEFHFCVHRLKSYYNKTTQMAVILEISSGSLKIHI